MFFLQKETDSNNVNICMTVLLLCWRWGGFRIKFILLSYHILLVRGRLLWCVWHMGMAEVSMAKITSNFYHGKMDIRDRSWGVVLYSPSSILLSWSSRTWSVQQSNVHCDPTDFFTGITKSSVVVVMLTPLVFLGIFIITAISVGNFTIFLSEGASRAWVIYAKFLKVDLKIYFREVSIRLS